MTAGSPLTVRLRELSCRSRERNFLTHTAFLTASEQAQFYDLVRREGSGQTLWGTPFVTHGGWADAERRVICFLPSLYDRDSFLAEEGENPQVVACVEASPVNARFADALTHRDYLGALMNLGLKRERIGDILTGPGDGRAGIFVLKENAELICRELVRVKHTTVVCREIPPAQCGIRPACDEVEGFVASRRLDALLAMVWHLSRGRAQELIQRELVAVDGCTVSSAGCEVKEGSRVSAKGYGKFRYLGVCGETRKGRLRVRVQVYR